MQILHKGLIAAVALTWIPSVTLALETESGLQFTIQPGTGNFIQFQSGPLKEGEKVHIYYDSLRVSLPANRGCPQFEKLTGITGYAMSDNSGKPVNFPLVSLDPPTVDFVKIGSFVTPECHNGRTELHIWFMGTDGNNACYDSNFGKNYIFPVICKPR